MRDFLEDTLERIIFASRWLLAPIYIVLCLSLLFITIKVIQETVHYLPLMLVQDVKGIMLFVLHIVDLVLVGNLVLMIIFAGYENFVSKMHVADEIRKQVFPQNFKIVIENYTSKLHVCRKMKNGLYGHRACSTIRI